MVYKTKPIDVLLEVENRSYRLGDSIDATVTLMPNGDVDIRKASLDLVLEERLTEVQMGRTMAMSGAGTLQGGNLHTTTDYVSMQQSTSHKSDSYVHSGTQFLGRTALKAGGQNEYRVALPVGSQPPKRLAESKERVKDANSSISFHWRLVVEVDVVRGRNPKVQRKLDIQLR